MPSIIQAGNAASTGLVTTGATDGILELRSGTAAGGTVAMTINAAGAVTASGSVGIGGATAGTTSYGAYATPLRVTLAGGLPYVEIVGASNQAGLLFNRNGSTGWFTGLNAAGSLRIARLATIDETGLTNAKDGTNGLTIDESGTASARIDGAGQLVQGRFNNETVGIVAESSIHLGYSNINFYGYRIANTSNPSATAAGTLRIQRGTGGSWVDALTIDNSGSIAVVGSLSKGSGSFRVDHPLPELTATRQLVHSFIEGPKADLIYRGKVALVDGQATVNIDNAATMTEGTFEVLCRDVQCFTTNESDWICVRGKVIGNILTIEAEDTTATSVVSWMVIGERQDPHMMETEWTDGNGRVIVEPLKPVPPQTLEEIK